MSEQTGDVQPAAPLDGPAQNPGPDTQQPQPEPTATSEAPVEQGEQLPGGGEPTVESGTATAATSEQAADRQGDPQQPADGEGEGDGEKQDPAPAGAPEPDAAHDPNAAPAEGYDAERAAFVKTYSLAVGPDSDVHDLSLADAADHPQLAGLAEAAARVATDQGYPATGDPQLIDVRRDGAKAAVSFAVPTSPRT